MFNIQYSSGLSPRTLTGARKARARCQVLGCGCSFVIRHSVFNIRYSTGLAPGRLQEPEKRGHAVRSLGVDVHSSFVILCSIFAIQRACPRTLTGARKTRARCQVLECGCSFVIRHSVFNIRYSTGLPPDAYGSPKSAGTLSGLWVWMFIRHS